MILSTPLYIYSTATVTLQIKILHVNHMINKQNMMHPYRANYPKSINKQ